jgi:hypothetical protein
MANLIPNSNINGKARNGCVKTDYMVPFMVYLQNIRSLSGKVDELLSL